MPLKREKWSAARLAYTAVQRRMIMSCIQRLNCQEKRALDAASFDCGEHLRLPRQHVRTQLREWFRVRWMYLVGEYEKVLPHVEELPDE